jgi:hypothetical protein
MNKLETFLSKPISDHKAFALALNSAIKELRAEDLGIDLFELAFEGDYQSLDSINQGSIYKTNDSILPSYLNSIPEQLKEVVNSWENSAVVYRGTRLPDVSGSFDFDGIHTTPHLHIANGYASGSANNSTGIGRLLKDIEGGFITAYEVPLSTPTYKNFEYEDMKKEGVVQSKTTLNDLKNTLIELSNKNGNEFYLDTNDAASPALSVYNSLVSNKSHYEVILSSDFTHNNIYFRNNKEFTKINPNNPKWDQLLARVQEASLRDFYEIVPLESLLRQTTYIQENSENKDILNKTKELILQQKEQFINAPWECSSMKDVNLINSEYINKRPYIKNSRCIGSAMDTSNVESPEIVQKLEKLVDAIRVNNLDLANSLVNDLENNKEVTIFIDKNKFVNNIFELRNSYLNNNQMDKMKPKLN